jgi:hypothetical protein
MMASFVIMEAPDNKPGAPEEKIEVIRDGFSFWAYLFNFVWLFWHRLWIEGIVVFAAMAVMSTFRIWPNFEFMTSVLAFLISLFVGLEGNNLRVAALRRRGWREVGVIAAASRADAELRFIAENRSAVAPAPVTHAPPSSNRMTPGRTAGTTSGPALGMLTLPGRR